MINFIKQKQKGSILAFAVIIMSFLMIIAIGLVASSLLTRKGVDISSNSTSAFQNTDKGMELFLYELYTNTKPFHTLNQLADSIVDSNGDKYKCEEVNENGEIVALITGAEFDVISYKEVDPNVNDGKGFVFVQSCDMEIARIYRLKITGHFATASRSIEVNLSDSLNRGLKSKWTFEDSAENVRLYDNNKNPQGSPIAKDRSKNDYILTLCPIESEGPFQLLTTKESKICPLMNFDESDETKGFYMSHLPKWDEGQFAKPDSDGICFNDQENKQVACGAFVSGIFADHANGKGIGKGGFSPVNYNLPPDNEGYYDEEYKTGSEAIEFNGYSNYLAPNLGSEGANRVREGSKESLSLDDSEGMSISLWFNNNSETGGENRDGSGKQVLVSKTENEKNGYELYLKDGEIFFRVNGREVSSDYGEDNQWHHVIARYDGSNDSGARNGIVIDGGVKEKFGLNGAGDIKDNSDIPLFIGGVYHGDDAEEFKIDDFEGGFGGIIDQVEIYNRYLIDFEAQKLCNMAAGEGWQSDSKNVAGLCASVGW